MFSPDFIHGAAFGVALVLIGWNAYLEIRLRHVQEDLFEQRRQSSYERISARTKVLSDSELDALLSKDLGGPATINKKT